MAEAGAEDLDLEDLLEGQGQPEGLSGIGDGVVGDDVSLATRNRERPVRDRRQPARLLFEDPGYQHVYTKDDKQKKRGVPSASDSESDSYDSEASEIQSDSSFEGDSQPEPSVNSNSSSDFDMLAKNDASRGELLRDESGEVYLHSRSQRQMRETFNKLNRGEQEGFDQDAMVLRQLLSLVPDRVHTLQDLEDNKIHDRALRSLYRARFGQSTDYSKISPHIKYDMLHANVLSDFKKKLKIEDEGYTFLNQTAKEGKASKGYALPYRSEVVLITDGWLLLPSSVTRETSKTANEKTSKRNKRQKTVDAEKLMKG